MAKRIVARVGEYTDREGKVKGEYVEVGVILESANGEFALLDPTVNMAGVLSKQNMYNAQQKAQGNDKAKIGTSVMCGIYDRDQQQAAPQTAPQTAPAQDFDADIPF